MPIKEAAFWFGITVFGTGLFGVMEGGNRLPYAIALLVIGLLVSVYSIVAHYRPQMPKIPIWLGLLLITWVAIGYDYYDRIHHPKIVERTVTVMEPYRFKWLGDNPQNNHVVGRRFVNERVLVDDTSFADCTFQNVTFVYNGTGTFSLSHNDIHGFNFDSDNPAVLGAIYLMCGLRALNIPVIDKATGRPPERINPAQITPGLKPPTQGKAPKISN
jgi:hypothetical protein